MIREICPHYHAPGTDDDEPEDRLCIAGQDGRGKDTQIRIVRMTGSWQWRLCQKNVAKAVSFDGLVA